MLGLSTYNYQKHFQDQKNIIFWCSLVYKFSVMLVNGD